MASIPDHVTIKDPFGQEHTINTGKIAKEQAQAIFHEIAENESDPQTALAKQVRFGSRNGVIDDRYAKILNAGPLAVMQDLSRTGKDGIQTLAEIARRCSVNDKTVAKYRESIFGNSEDRLRTVARNGTTYQQNTASIGKKADDPPPFTGRRPAVPAIISSSRAITHCESSASRRVDTANGSRFRARRFTFRRRATWTLAPPRSCTWMSSAA